LLAGPALVCAAAVAVLRARRLARRLDGAGERTVRPPLADLAALTGYAMPALDAARLLLLTTCLAAAAAFVRDRAEHASPGQAVVTSGIEATAVVACFVALGPLLGLWRRRTD
jgi:hypothetical protein